MGRPKERRPPRRSHNSCPPLERVAAGCALALILCGTLHVLAGQDAAAPGTAAQRKEPNAVSSPSLETHRFWDKTNAALFVGVGAARTLDYVSTRHFRDRGVDEWLLTNDMVDNKALFVGMEAAATAASIGVSYLFHRSGHHKLERWVSLVHLGAGVAGSARNFTLSNKEASYGAR
jgi:hypothetical protein